MSTPCSMNLVCINGEFMKGNAAKCALCRLSPDNTGRAMTHFWAPTTSAKITHTKHPELEAEKRTQKLTRRLLKLEAKSRRDPKKRQVSRLARQAERSTEKHIIQATKNSGRRNKDGDHVFQGSITLDTKLQTTRENPVVLLGELEKVRSDAARAGKAIGGLVIRNKNNVGVVVLTEEDFAHIMAYTWPYILQKDPKKDEPAH